MESSGLQDSASPILGLVQNKGLPAWRGCIRLRLSQIHSALTGPATVLTSSIERCYMKLNVKHLVGVLLLSTSLFASPRSNRDHDRDRRPHHSVPEPGSMLMLTLTAGTLVGGLFVRRRIQPSAVR